mgnify:CR=1 FL=1
MSRELDELTRKIKKKGKEEGRKRETGKESTAT